jgi:hypothetical protein
VNKPGKENFLETIIGNKNIFFVEVLLAQRTQAREKEGINKLLSGGNPPLE